SGSTASVKNLRATSALDRSVTTTAHQAGAAPATHFQADSCHRTRTAIFLSVMTTSTIFPSLLTTFVVDLPDLSPRK
ncbi:MAG TPA: hypothetical protein VJ283_18190, partial [Trebonia sp.]|nr:hypothetical protein [Trebonia sp.]